MRFRPIFAAREPPLGLFAGGHTSTRLGGRTPRADPRAIVWYAKSVAIHDFASHALTVATAIASVLVAIRLLSTRRPPQSLLAWLLAIAFVPLVAIPLYLLFGARKFVSEREREWSPAEKKPKRAHHHGRQAPHAVATLLETMAAPPARAGHTFELLPTGEVAFSALLSLFARAEKTIDVTIFILGRDATGLAVVDALAERARSGVRVRLILDAVGCARIARHARTVIGPAGGEVARFMPLLHAPVRGRTNLRSHRKIVVVDRTHVLLGGMNMALEYMGSAPLPGRWRDLSAVVSGPVAGDAERIFEADWAFAMGRKGTPRNPVESSDDLDAASEPTSQREPGAEPGGALVQLVPSGPDMREDTFYSALVTAISMAKERVTVVSAYYVPDDVVQRAMVLSAMRGVKTELVVPSRSNHALADFARRGLLRELDRAGVELRFFPSGMLHAKALVVDDTLAFVGSPNMDMRSFFLNYEDALFLYDRDSVARMRAWADQLLAECTSTSPHPKREYWLLEQVARVLAPEL